MSHSRKAPAGRQVRGHARAAAHEPRASPADRAAETPAWPREVAWATAMFVVALLPAALHLWQFHQTPFFDLRLGDAESYDAWARRIAAGDWLGREVFYQAPLYPYLLGLLYWLAGPSLLVVRGVQAVLGAVACVLLADATTRLWSRPAGTTAGLMLAFYPPVVFSGALVQKSALDIFFVCLLLWILARIVGSRSAVAGDDQPREPRKGSVHWMLLGLATGALVLTRENAGVLAIVVPAWILAAARFAGRRRATIACFTAGFAIVLLPVGVRNAVVAGEFHLTTSQFGPNFFIGNHAGADGTYQSLLPMRGRAAYEQADAAALAEDALGRRLSPGEVSAYFTRRTLADIESAPGRWIRLLLRKFALLWNAIEIADTEDQYAAAEYSSVLRLGQAWHLGVLAPLALAGLIVAWPDRGRLSILTIMIAAYSGSVVLFYVFARYRLPMVPFLIVFAAIALTGARAACLGRPRSAIAAAVAAVLAFAAFCNWPLLHADQMRATMHYNLGVGLDRAGRLPEAEREFRTAIGLQPRLAAAHNDLGLVLGRTGRLDEARAAFERAVAIDPRFAKAENNLGETLMAEGRVDEAIPRFERAALLDPRSAQPYNDLGLARARQGQIDRAIAAYEQALRIDPDHVRAHGNLAAALGRAGRLDEAAAHCRRALELDPAYAEAANNLGMIAAARGQWEDAATQFGRALELAPGNAQTRNNLGLALVKLGRLEQARAEFEQASALDPGFSQARANLAAVLAQLARPPGPPPPRSSAGARPEP